MPKKHNADGSPRRKKTFGGANVDRFSPPPSTDVPKAINCVLSFEEALKLHLSLVQVQATFFRFLGCFLGGSVCWRCSCCEQP